MLRRRALIALLFGAAILAFAPALSAPFIFDDLTAIDQNESIRTLSSGIFTPPANTSVAGRPVVNVTFALNYALNEAFGVDQRPDPDGRRKTVGYHVVNLLLHVATGALLLALLRRTMRKPRVPALPPGTADGGIL